MRWEPATHEALIGIRPQAAQSGELLAEAIRDLDAEVLREYARVLWDGETPIAVYGAQPQWSGVAHGWAIFSDEALRHPIHIIRGGVRWLRYMMEERGFHRIHITCRPLDPMRRLAKALGMKYEGTLQNYDPWGHTHEMYARVSWQQ